MKTLTHGSGAVDAHESSAASPPAPHAAGLRPAHQPTQQTTQQTAQQTLLTRHTLPSLSDVRGEGVPEDVYFLTKSTTTKEQPAQQAPRTQPANIKTTKTLIGTQPLDYTRGAAHAPKQAKLPSQPLQSQQTSFNCRPTWPSAPASDKQASRFPNGKALISDPHLTDLGARPFHQPRIAATQRQSAQSQRDNLPHRTPQPMGAQPHQNAAAFPVHKGAVKHHVALAPNRLRDMSPHQSPRQSFRKLPPKSAFRSPWKSHGKPIWKPVYPPPRFPASVPLHPLIPPRPGANLAPQKPVEDRWISAIVILLLGVMVALVAALAFITVTETPVAALEPLMNHGRSILPVGSSSR